MNLIKELNLNKNPQYAKEGSFVYAKNIKISNDSNCIITDDGLRNVLIGANLIQGDIVDVVSTDKELIIFTNNNKIYRYSETTTKTTLCDVPWEYNGGEIIGTYCYNCNNQLILAVAEYDADKDVPLKIFNLDKEILSDYETNICPQFPIVQIQSVDKVRGSSMPQGIYQLFIRFEISTDYYTKWKPIGSPLYALYNTYQTIINHTRKVSGSNKSLTLGTVVNTELDCLYNFKIDLSFKNYESYKKFQIGYIVQHDNDTLCRIWKSFSIGEASETIIFDAKNHTEGDISDFTDIPFNVYNVKNVLNYNNSLYIANFKETEYNVKPTEAIQSFIDSIKVIPKAYDITENISNNVRYEEWNFGLRYNAKTEGITITRPVITKDLYSINDPEVYAIKKSIIEGNCFYYNKKNIFEILHIKFSKSNTVEFAIYNDISQSYNYYTSLYLYKEPDSAQPIGIEYTIKNVKYRTFTKDINQIVVDNTIRTLQGDEVYSFYIHFVRNDGTYTNGYKLKNTAPSTMSDIDLITKITDSSLIYNKITALSNNYLYEVLNNSVIDSYFGYYENQDGDILFKAPSNYDSTNNSYRQIGVEFKTSMDVPNGYGYVGYFFTYEQVEPLVKWTGKSIKNNANGCAIKNLFKATDAELGLNNIIGTIYKSLYVLSETGELTPLNKNLKYISFAEVIPTGRIKELNGNKLNTTGYNRVIYLDLYEATNDSNDLQPYNVDNNEVGTIITLNRNIYTSKVKTLIKLTDVITTNNELSPTTYNYPAFIVKDKILYFDHNITITDTNAQVFDLSYDTNEYDITDTKATTTVNYAYIEEYIKVSNYNLNAVTFKVQPQYKTYTIENKTTSFINIIVTPENEQDLFELKGTYIEKPIIIYTNFDKERENQDIKTSVIRRSKVISDESVQNNWLYFDATQYKTILKSKNEITNLTTIKDNFIIHTKSTILLLDASQRLKGSTSTSDITISQQDIFEKEITEILDATTAQGGLQYKKACCNTDKGYFFYDHDNNSIFRFSDKIEDISFNIKRFLANYNIIDSVFIADNKNNRLLINLKINKNENYDFVTLSFNTNLGVFVSIHDFDFDKAVFTKNNAYLYLYNPRRGKDDQQPDKTSSVLTFDSSRPCDYNIFRAESNCFPKLSSVLNYVDKGFCFDIIINSNYEQSKVINSIDYIVNEFENFEDTIHDTTVGEDLLPQKRLDINKLYNVDYIRLYSNSTDTDYIDVRNDDINNIQNNTNKLYKKAYYDKGAWNFNYFRNKINEMYQKMSNLANKNTQLIANDNMSLIYGNYIIVRFIGKVKANHIKFENFDANLDNY